MTALTATNKIKLNELHSAYMTNACEPGVGREREASDRRAQKFGNQFRELYTLLGLTMRQAEIIAWEVNQNYYPTLLEAIEEGYTNKYIEVPATLAYIKRQALKVAA